MNQGKVPPKCVLRAPPGDSICAPREDSICAPHSYAPKSTGALIIKHKRYKIHVPSDVMHDPPPYISTCNYKPENIILEDDNWKNFGKPIHMVFYDFVWTDFIMAFCGGELTLEDTYEGPEPTGPKGEKLAKKMAIANFVMDTISAGASALKITPIQIVKQRNINSKDKIEERVIIQIGCKVEKMQAVAGKSFIIYGPRDEYDYRVTFDEKHASDLYTGFLSINSKKQLVFTPKIYEGDKIEMGYALSRKSPTIFRDYLRLYPEYDNWDETVGYREDILRKSIVLDNDKFFGKETAKKIREKFEKGSIKIR